MAATEDNANGFEKIASMDPNNEERDINRRDVMCMIDL